MSFTDITIFIIIILARICDVSFGTLRTIATVKGWQIKAVIFGLLEVIIWLAASSAVLVNIQSNPFYAIAYCVGYACGIYVGMRLDNWFASGDSLVRILTRQGDKMTMELRAEGCRVTRINGSDKQGLVSLLYVDLRKRDLYSVLKEIHQIDADAFYTIDDVKAKIS